MRLGDLLVLCLAACVAPGCDPIWHVDGVVVDEHGVPVAGAEVGSDCGGKPLFAQHTRTDAKGHWSLRTTGPIPNSDCVITAIKTGYVPAKVDTPGCPSQWNSCRQHAGTLELRSVPASFAPPE
jgi:hypothetical protein